MSEQSSSERLGMENPKIMKFFRLIGKISKWQGEIFSFLVLIAGIQVVYELILRYVFNAPTMWGLELTIYLCGITYIMGGAYAELHNANIRIDLLYNRWSPRTRLIINLFIIHWIFFLFVGIFAWESWKFFWVAITQGQTSGTAWDPKIWPLRLLMFLGSTTLLLLGFAKFLHDLSTAIRRREPV